MSVRYEPFPESKAEYIARGSRSIRFGIADGLNVPYWDWSLTVYPRYVCDRDGQPLEPIVRLPWWRWAVSLCVFGRWRLGFVASGPFWLMLESTRPESSDTIFEIGG